MSWSQISFKLVSKPRGFHLITNEILNSVDDISTFKIGTAHIFICHTSASLTLNENASPDVRQDMECHFNTAIPENAPFYTHVLEGADDMPAHIKSTLIGSSVLVPITNGTFNLGTWQGIYLCEHRNAGGTRKIILTLCGEKYPEELV